MNKRFAPQIMVDGIWTDCKVLTTDMGRYTVLVNGETKNVVIGSFRNFYLKPCYLNCENCRYPCSRKE